MSYIRQKETTKKTKKQTNKTVGTPPEIRTGHLSDTRKASALSQLDWSVGYENNYFMSVRNPAKSILRSLSPSVHPYAKNTSKSRGRIFVKFHIGQFYEKLTNTFNFKFSLERICFTTTFHEDLHRLRASR
jgi:hypothetical protein